MSDQPNAYEVEAIVDRKVQEGKVFYFIKWSGFDSAENTWEPEESILDPNIIKQFEEAREKKRKERLEAASAPRARRSAKPTETSSTPSTSNNNNTTTTTTITSTPTTTTTTQSDSGERQAKRQKTEEPKSENSNNNVEPVKAQIPLTSKQIAQTLDAAVKAEVGFEHEDQLDSILGARIISEKLHFYCSWVGRKERSFVPAEFLNVRMPQKVIEFYESRIKFELPDESRKRNENSNKLESATANNMTDVLLTKATMP